MSQHRSGPAGREGGSASVSAASGIGWLLIFAALLVWEGLGLLRLHDGWYTVSDLLRNVTASAAGRWVLFAIWLWIGWHLFIRGWQFFLRALPSSGPSPTTPGLEPSASKLLRQDIGPMLLVFGIAVSGVWFWFRSHTHPRRGHPAAATSEPISLRRWLRDLGVTMLAGYGLFLAVDGAYYWLAAGQTRAFIRQAFTGGAFLAFVAAPIGFVAVTAIALGLGRLGIRLRRLRAPGS
jgi:hypothetical protein